MLPFLRGVMPQVLQALSKGFQQRLKLRVRAVGSPGSHSVGFGSFLNTRHCWNSNKPEQPGQKCLCAVQLHPGTRHLDFWLKLAIFESKESLDALCLDTLMVAKQRRSTALEQLKRIKFLIYFMASASGACLGKHHQYGGVAELPGHQGFVIRCSNLIISVNQELPGQHWEHEPTQDICEQQGILFQVH